jgi:hypothetical protein
MPDGPGTDHQHVFARLLLWRLEAPALLDGFVAEETFDRVDAHRVVELAAVAGAFAAVVADAAHDRRKRVVGVRWRQADS